MAHLLNNVLLFFSFLFFIGADEAIPSGSEPLIEVVSFPQRPEVGVGAQATDPIATGEDEVGHRTCTLKTPNTASGQTITPMGPTILTGWMNLNRVRWQQMWYAAAHVNTHPLTCC